MAHVTGAAADDTSELALIARVGASVARRGGTTLGIGDDAAILDGEPPGLVTTDLLVEGVHFTRHGFSWQDVGHKAMAVNVSDVAAMGGRAVAATVALALPAGNRPSLADVEAMYAGMEALAAREGVTIAGGDTSDTPGEVMVVSVTVIGRMDPGVAPVRRSGARPGDVLAVTGPLGASEAGLLLLEDPALGAGLDGRDTASLLRAQRRPEPRTAYGPALAAAGVHAMMDLSDGLLLDAQRIAVASGVTVTVDLAGVPRAAGVDRVAALAGREADVLAATGGEDYELLVALPPRHAEELRASGVPLVAVGRVSEGPAGIRVLRRGDGVTLDRLGWEHGT